LVSPFFGFSKRRSDPAGSTAGRRVTPDDERSFIAAPGDEDRTAMTDDASSIRAGPIAATGEACLANSVLQSA